MKYHQHPLGHYIVDITDCRHLIQFNPYAEVRPEVVEWLNEMTPGWGYLPIKVLQFITLETLEHVGLFKLAWWNT